MPTNTDLFSTLVSGRIQLVSFGKRQDHKWLQGPTVDKELQEYTSSLQRTPIQLSSTRSTGRKSRVCIDLDSCDIELLTSVINVKGWSHEVAVIALVEGLKSNLVAAVSNTPSLPEVFPIVSVCVCVCVCILAVVDKSSH